MEQRTILAVALSLFVLLTYQAVFIKHPPPAQPVINKSQGIDIKQDTLETNKPSSIVQEKTIENVGNIYTESTEVIENNNLVIEFSNLGGKIKSILIKDASHKIPITNILNVTDYDSLPFILENKNSNSIQYSFLDNGMKVEKSYSFSDENSILAQIKFLNVKEMSKLNNISISAFSVNTQKLTEKEIGGADSSLFEYSISASGVIFRKSNAHVFSKKEAKSQIGVSDWFGFRDRFYCALVQPLFKTASYSIDPESEKLINLRMRPENIGENSKGNYEYKFVTYFGHQDENILKKYNAGFEKIVSFSNFSIIDFISKSIVKIMDFIHKIVPNWGFCIIAVCILIYALMYPLTMSGMKSMRRMQSLQPKMAQMKEQYKNNPQKLNKEVMELYKKNSVNPLGGCFPFILQMPIFIGLYQGLWRNPHLNGASFLWIKDLAAPDRLLIFKNSLPFIGNEFNILPIFMMIVMFFQQKLSTKNMTTTDPTQLSQQKMMSILFPVMLGVIFYKFSSGLTLYFTIFYLFSTFTQWKMSKVTVEVIS